MGMIEDVRGVLQDLVVPDLKALEQRVTSLEQNMDRRFAEVEKSMERRFAEAEKSMDQRFAGVEKSMDQRFAGVEKSMERRFAEQEKAAETRHKELITYLALDARVRKIEQDHVSIHEAERLESTEKHAR